MDIYTTRAKLVMGKTCNKCGISLEGDKFHPQSWGTKCYTCFRSMMNRAASEKKQKMKDNPVEYIRHKYGVYCATARQRNIQRGISPQDLIAIFNKQEGKCLFTGVKLQTMDENNWDDYLTLDRMDNEEGYMPGNVAFVTRTFNQSIKKNIPIDFIKEWIPKMYEIIEQHRLATK